MAIYRAQLSVDTSAVSDVRVVDEALMPTQAAFGSKFDGVTPGDQVGINACIAAAAAAGKGRVQFPDRAALLTAPIVVPAGTGDVEIHFGSRFHLLAPGSNSQMLIVNDTADATGATRVPRVRLRSMFLDQQGQQQTDAASGTQACVSVYQTDDFEGDTVHIRNPRNTGFSWRNGKRGRAAGKWVVENVIGHLGANAVNIGGSSSIGGYEAAGFTGDQLDVIASNMVITDAAITAGQKTLASAQATFTAADVGKTIIINGAGNGGGKLTNFIESVNTGVATLRDAAGTTVAAATARYGFVDVALWWGGANCKVVEWSKINVWGGCNSGLMSEGGAQDSRYLQADLVYVENARNIAAGWSDALGTNTLKHEKCSISQLIAVAPVNGLVAVGNHLSVEQMLIDGFLETGVQLGGLDYPETDIFLQGTVKADPAATGAGCFISKAGGGTNYLDTVRLDLLLDGQGGGGYGLQIQGKVRGVSGRIRTRNWKNSGGLIQANGGASPSDVRLDVRARNNNQAGNGAGVSSVGFAASAGDDLDIELRATDDQAVKTQTHAWYWNGPTNSRFRGGNYNGNLTGVFASAAFDAGTILAPLPIGWSVISVASAASITLPPGPVVRVNGTTTITSIAIAPAGTIQTLRFASAACQVTDNNGTLNLNGNYVSTANGTLTLASDGTNWYEVCRGA